MNKSILSILALLALCAAPAVAVPSGINYQGALTDDQGNPITGTRTMSIKLYDAAAGGNVLYSEDIGTVDVSDGVFSFEFGAGGTSNAEQSDTVAITDGTATSFQKVLSAAEVVAGSISATDGTYTWSQLGGSSNEDDFGAVYNSSLRRVTVTYYNGAPAAGRTITATYRTPTGGISGALAGNNQPWAEVAVGGIAQVPRQKVLTVPFAQVSARTLETEKADPIARQAVADLQQAVAQTSGIELGTITKSTNSVGNLIGVLSQSSGLAGAHNVGIASKLVKGVTLGVGSSYASWRRGSITIRYIDASFVQHSWEINRTTQSTLVYTNPHPAKRVTSIETSAQEYWDIAGYFINFNHSYTVVGAEEAFLTFDAGSRSASRVYVSPSTNAPHLSDKKAVVFTTDSNSIVGAWNQWIDLPANSTITSVSLYGTPTNMTTTSLGSLKLLLLRQ